VDCAQVTRERVVIDVLGVTVTLKDEPAVALAGATDLQMRGRRCVTVIPDCVR